MPDPKRPSTKNDDEEGFGATLVLDGEPLKNLSSPIPRPTKSYILGPLAHELASSPVDATPDLPFGSSSSGNVHPRSQRTTASSLKSFASSPLKPLDSTAPSSFSPSPFNRSGSRTSTHINRIASEESRALAAHQSLNRSRGSMILYRCADSTTEDVLQPPTPSHLHRDSVLSVSGDSIVSLSSDSKYPTTTIASDRGLIAYAYDPSLDDLGTATPADDDFLHDDPDEKQPQQPRLLSLRGIFNILSLMTLLTAFICLFVVYPIISFYRDNARNVLITFNTKVNRSGQANSDAVILQRRSSQSFFAEPIPLIDSSTPLHARVLNTAQDITYGLVFSDEFTQNGRSFNADHDLIWESSVYDSSQINTKHGSLSVRLDNLQPQDRDRYNNKDGCQVRPSAIYTDRSLSGILKMKAPLCLSRGGLVEVGLGKKDESTLRRLLYWPGSSESWSSFNQSETPNIPADLLTSDPDAAGTLLLSLSIGIPIDDLERTTRTVAVTAASDSDSNLSCGVEAEVDYVRIYQPIIKSSLLPLAEETILWECGAVRNDVMLDLLKV